MRSAIYVIGVFASYVLSEPAPVPKPYAQPNLIPRALARRQDTCPAGDVACYNTCIDPTYACCVGGGGCPVGYDCQGDGCCPTGETCSGVVSGCVEGSVTCAGVCIPTGHICCGSFSCPAGQSCGTDGSCLTGGNTVPASATDSSFPSTTAGSFNSNTGVFLTNTATTDTSGLFSINSATTVGSTTSTSTTPSSTRSATTVTAPAATTASGSGARGGQLVSSQALVACVGLILAVAGGAIFVL